MLFSNMSGNVPRQSWDSDVRPRRCDHGFGAVLDGSISATAWELRRPEEGKA